MDTENQAGKEAVWNQVLDKGDRMGKAFIWSVKDEGQQMSECEDEFPGTLYVTDRSRQST
jgi:hypothetical protein